MIIRPATPSDASAIAEVHIASWRHSYAGIVPGVALASLCQKTSERNWARILGALTPESVCLVATDETGRIAGFVNAGPAKDGDLQTDGEIYAIYLAADAQRHGIGTELFRLAADHLRNAGFRSMCLWFLRDNLAARKFYARLGGTFQGERPYVGQFFDLPSCGCKWNL